MLSQTEHFLEHLTKWHCWMLLLYGRVNLADMPLRFNALSGLSCYNDENGIDAFFAGDRHFLK